MIIKTVITTNTIYILFDLEKSKSKLIKFHAEAPFFLICRIPYQIPADIEIIDTELLKE